MPKADENRESIQMAVEAVMRMEADGGWAIVAGPDSKDVWPDADGGLYVQWARSQDELRFEACEPGQFGGTAHSPAVVSALEKEGLSASEGNYIREFEVPAAEGADWQVVAQEVTQLACDVMFNVFGLDPSTELEFQVESN